MRAATAPRACVTNISEWMAQVTSRTRAGSGTGLTADRPPVAARRGRPTTAAKIDLVLEIWQELVGATLSPDSVLRFRAHPDCMTLCRYDRQRLEVAGRQLYGRTGRLLLAEWAPECAWDGAGSISLSWAELAAGDPDAGVVARDLVAAVVGTLASDRERAILTQRLGLDGEPPQTLQAIADPLGITRERVRQVQERALVRMCIQRGEPGPRKYARYAITALLSQAESAGAGKA